MIKEQEKTGRWTFTYLGASVNAQQIAKDMGISKGNIQQFAANSKGVKISTQNVTRGLGSYYRELTKGEGSISNFFDKDK